MTDELRQGVTPPGDGDIAASGEDVQRGASGTRLWPDEVKARIVAELVGLRIDGRETKDQCKNPHGSCGHRNLLDV